MGCSLSSLYLSMYFTHYSRRIVLSYYICVFPAGFSKLPAIVHSFHYELRVDDIE